MQYALPTIVRGAKISQKISFPHGGSFSTSLSIAFEITSALYAEVTRTFQIDVGIGRYHSLSQPEIESGIARYRQLSTEAPDARRKADLTSGGLSFSEGWKMLRG